MEQSSKDMLKNPELSKLSTDEDSDFIHKITLGHITFTLEYHSFESCDDLFPEQAEAKYKTYFLNRITKFNNGFF